MQVQWKEEQKQTLPQVGECWCYDWGEDLYMRINPNYMTNEEAIVSVNLNTGDLMETSPESFSEINKVNAKITVD